MNLDTNIIRRHPQVQSCNESSNINNADEENPKGKCSEKLSGCGKFIYNSETKQFLGRTALSWLQITVFYIIFFAFLVAILTLLMKLFYIICIGKKPFLTGEISMLRFSPGLQFHPSFHGGSSAFLFSFNNKSKLYKRNVDDYEKYLDKIEKNPPADHLADCHWSNMTKFPDDVDKLCGFNKSKLGPCQNPIQQLAEGYICLFVTVNNIYGWLPELKNLSILGMPLYCTVNSASDFLNMESMQYYPRYPLYDKSGFFPHIYFPFLNQKHYQKSYVALHIKVRQASITFFECHLKNINSYNFQKYGKLRFLVELAYIDDLKQT